ncbi:TPA_asm: hypothetical protein vir530_00031 [dsDNA virus vir530]|jgi:hypothetical protein|nr:TPA_asm: hypothetical protein vir530_00031 [dsDNA virus vir530]
MPGQEFERDMVHAWNNYAATYGKKLVAYRHYQMRYQPQLFDVLVDSRPNEFYLALECKSIDPTTVPQLYFKQHFSSPKGIHQVVRESEWLSLSGRNGFLVVELRRGRGKRTSCFFVPWRSVAYNFKAGLLGIDSEIITRCPACDKRAGKYTFDDEFVEEVVRQLDSYPKNPKSAYKKKWSK